MTYIEKKSEDEQEELVYENLDDDVKEGDIVVVGDFRINIEKVSKS